MKSPSKIYPSLAITDADLEETELAVEKAVSSLSNIYKMHNLNEETWMYSTKMDFIQ